ncbi:homeodomain-interacting protein kinase 2-like isoform X2 [Scomber scombrus]|uniref:Homeodomain-interacting protein kinase 2-like isoform X2 n=1 Tax=Scomber scombrus TaxID=13677 RepID=A0AAV1N5Z6_SCOSC
MLKMIRGLDPINIIRLCESFKYMEKTCLASKMLDKNLHELLKERRGNPLSLQHIRPMTQQMKTMVQTLGQPEDQMLDDGTHTLLYFSQNKKSTKPAWRLKTADEHKALTGFPPQNHSGSSGFSSLDDLVMMQLYPEAGKVEERTTFVCLLKQMLPTASPVVTDHQEPQDDGGSADEASTVPEQTDLYDAGSADKGPVTTSTADEVSASPLTGLNDAIYSEQAESGSHGGGPDDKPSDDATGAAGEAAVMSASTDEASAAFVLTDLYDLLQLKKLMKLQLLLLLLIWHLLQLYRLTYMTLLQLTKVQSLCPQLTQPLLHLQRLKQMKQVQLESQPPAPETQGGSH